MDTFSNASGNVILQRMITAIQENKALLGDIDGLIGDGDHGMNMNKGFTLYQEQLGDQDVSFSEGLNDLGTVLFNQIGGSMGPIYGTLFFEMADQADGADNIDLLLLSKMLSAGLQGLYEIIEARPGDKTLVDTLHPAVESLKQSVDTSKSLPEALEMMKTAAATGRDSTVNMVAKFGRSARLGERSRGVPDAGATSCCIILHAIANGILSEVK